MWKYIVTWVLVTTTTVECPDANTVDEFGSKSNSIISCAVNHMDTSRASKEKVFTNRDSAYSFLNRAKNQKKHWIFEDGLENVKIDSLRVE